MEKEEVLYNWPELMDQLTRLLRLKAPPIGMKFLDSAADLDKIPKLRRCKEGEKFNACQLVGQVVRLNFTLGITKENLFGSQCEGVLGLCTREHFAASRHLTGSWYKTDEETAIHQEVMYHFDKVYEAVALSPLATNRLPEPDVCLVYATPQQIMFIGNALQHYDYEVLEGSFVGESACSDAWTRAIVTDKPCMTIPCYGERRYGGVLDDEMVIAFPPKYIHKIIEGLNWLSKNGLRYPAAYYGIQQDASIGLAKSYAWLKK